MAGAYRPAGLGDQVGGDFYDVFETGRDDWALVLGDVCGKGPEAAAVTALARYTLRAAAMRTRRPKHVLATLNRALLQQQAERFCTVVYARLRCVQGRWQVTVSSGGHPLPMHLTATGAAAVGRPGDLLGVLDTPLLHDVTFDLCGGEKLVFFTDGVTEARAGDEFYGEERPRQAAHHHDAGHRRRHGGRHRGRRRRLPERLPPRRHRCRGRGRARAPGPRRR